MPRRSPPAATTQQSPADKLLSAVPLAMVVLFEVTHYSKISSIRPSPLYFNSHSSNRTSTSSSSSSSSQNITCVISTR
ncbi:hypothetical protein E2C01_034249 [Portunus trituberculatus]|uniref:Uncharacterized protein n=1 Tax=Portunus trituberculatus TaxID=210409 RepID=A0A5B7F812_PORTR|nr:hypothetical protein [Portunus trituberculatus]